MSSAANYDFNSGTIVLIVVLLILGAIVIGGILFGNAQARERHRVEEAAEERAAEAGADLPSAPPPPASGDGGALPPPPPPPQTDPQAVPEPPAPQPEPVAAPTPPEPAPAPEPVAAPAPAVESAIAGALALTTIKGLGPKVAAMLAERGITQVAQIAVLSPDDAAALDAELGTFAGRMARDRWIDQAKLLSAGNTAAYEAEFGKLG